MKKYVLLSFCLLIILSCSANRTYVVMDPYSGKLIKGKTLGIAPLIPKPVIENSIEVIQQIGDGHPSNVYYNYFSKNFERYLKRNSFFKDVFYMDIDSTIELSDTEFTLSDKRKLNFRLPEQGKTINKVLIKPDFILFIQNVIVSRGRVRVAPIFGGGTIAIPGKSRQYGKFIFWDNIKGNVVSFGEFDEDNDLNKSAIHNIVRKVLHDSPFENRRKNRESRMRRSMN